MSDVCVYLCVCVVILGSEDQEEGEDHGSVFWQIQAAGGTMLPSVHPGESGEYECGCLSLLKANDHLIDYECITTPRFGLIIPAAGFTREDLKVILNTVLSESNNYRRRGEKIAHRKSTVPLEHEAADD